MKWENRDINVSREVSLSAIWRLGENVVLQLMECLTPSVSFDIFMDNYFRYSRLLTYRGVNNIRAARVLNYANALSLGTNSCKKKGTWPL